MTNVEELGPVFLMSELKYLFCLFLSVFFSDFHLCSTGDTNSTFGTRGGDSGTLVFLEENGRYCSVTNCYHYYSSVHHLRYTGVGINSFNSDPDVFAKVTQDVKEWIQSIAQTQDSDCSSTKGFKGY